MKTYKIEISEDERKFLALVCGAASVRAEKSIKELTKNGRAKKGYSLALKDAKNRDNMGTKLEKFFIELKK